MHSKIGSVAAILSIGLFGGCTQNQNGQADAPQAAAREPAQSAYTRGAFFNGQVEVESERISVQTDNAGVRQTLFLYRVYDRQHRVVCYSNAAGNFHCVPSAGP